LAEHGYVEEEELEMIAKSSAEAQARIGNRRRGRDDRKRAAFYERVLEVRGKTRWK
jgi:hypothetical protein